MRPVTIHRPFHDCMRVIVWIRSGGMITEISCFVYASFQRRMVAYLIDGLLLGISVKLFQYLLSLSHLVPVIATGGLLLGGLRFLYAPFCHARWGQTPGKRVMQIKVT